MRPRPFVDPRRWSLVAPDDAGRRQRSRSARECPSSRPSTSWLSWPRLPPRWRTDSGRVDQARDGVLDPGRAQDRVVHGRDRLAGQVLRVLEDVGDRVDRPDHRLLLLERGLHLGRRAVGDPRRRSRGRAPSGARPARCGRRTTARRSTSGWPTRRITRSAIDCELADSPSHLPSRRLVGVARRRPFGAAARPTLDIARAGRRRAPAGPSSQNSGS